MNKNKIFNADGQADTDSIERSEKRSSQIYDKNLCNRYKCIDSGTVCNKKALSLYKGSEIFEVQGNSK